MKSIKTKILLSAAAIILVISASVGVLSLGVLNKTAETLIEKSMVELSEMAALSLDKSFDEYISLTKELAADKALLADNWSNIDFDTKEKEFIQRTEAKSVLFIDKTGKTQTGSDVSDQYYFTQCRKTFEPVISDFIISKDTNDFSLFFAAPIIKDGEFNGVVAVENNALMLSDVINEIHFAQSQSNVIVDKSGTIIASVNTQRVLNKENIITQANQLDYASTLIPIYNNILSGASGFEKIAVKDTSKLIAYYKIEHTQDWTLILSIDSAEFTEPVIKALAATGKISIWIMLGILIFSALLANSLAKPLKLAADRIKLLGEGDLKTPIKPVKSKSEAGILTQGTKKTIDNLNEIIAEITYLLSELAKGNFNLTVEKNYPGDFAPIKEALIQIIESLNDALVQVNDSSELLKNGSEQVSVAAHNLAEGVTDQASSIEEITATIANISQQIENNSQNANKASEVANETLKLVNYGNKSMKEMMKVINDINESSESVSKIIKSIEAIATQTNLLSLNAAIEAAQAGDAGRGFSVIAENIGKLATESAESAKNTTLLIENILELIHEGTITANQAAHSLDEIVEATDNITNLITEIATASETQAVSMTQTTQGVEQISTVVQANAATAEETSATSIELNSQAALLNDLIKEFKLNKHK